MTEPTETKPVEEAPFDVVGSTIDYEQGELSSAGTLKLFSHLVKTGQAKTLQGHYGRAAKLLVERGLLTQSGDITQYGKTICGIT